MRHQQDDSSIQAQSMESYRHQRFLEGLSRDFAALREDNEAWKTEKAERAEWDAALV